jgi:hypothetical protein
MLHFFHHDGPSVVVIVCHFHASPRLLPRYKWRRFVGAFLFSPPPATGEFLNRDFRGQCHASSDGEMRGASTGLSLANRVRVNTV